MKKNFLAYMIMLVTVMVTACQTEEVKPTSKTETAEQSSDVANAKVATPAIKVTSATLVDTGTGFYYFTFGVSGASDYCAPSGKLTVKWYLRQHNSAGAVTSESLVQTDTQKYDCIKNGKKYVTTNTGYISGGQIIRVSFLARIYNAQGGSLGTASTGVGVYNTPQGGL